jgi:hypothetical protein
MFPSNERSKQLATLFRVSKPQDGAAMLVHIILGVALAQGPLPSPGDLVRQMVDHELKTEQADNSHWLFRRQIQKPNGAKETDEVVETKDGDLARPLEINGNEISKQQADQQVQRAMRNSSALRKAMHDKNEDAARSQRMLKMLPDAFNYKYGEHRGDLVELLFSPNPKFRPPNHEAEVFHAMQGTLWLDSKQLRLEELSGHLIHEVKFMGGVLGHLDPGGTFDVKQSEVAPGYWELVLLNVHMRGKALFFKTISVQQNRTRSDFERVPDDLTLAKGAAMLEKQFKTAQK